MAASTHPIMKIVVGLLTFLLVAACENGTGDDPHEISTPDQRESANLATSRGGQAMADLDRLDPRQPVPLLPMMAWHQKQNMQEHLVAVQDILDSVARTDWEGVIQASARIQSSPQMQQMCEHMGAGAEGFTELALEFHRRADHIAPAAHERSTRGVLEATANTLDACTNCHSLYRQEVVDAETWAQRTGRSYEAAESHDRH